MDGDSIARMYQNHAHWLQVEINRLGEAFRVQSEEIESLRRENAALRAENLKFRQRIDELTGKAVSAVREVPAFVKPNVRDGPGRKRGRPAGHEAAWRPRPGRIHVKQEVALPTDGRGKPACPHCRTQLSRLRYHRRIVEDIVPSRVITTCYRTHSGYCPSCRRRVESRAEDQPPGADIAQTQLGLNALATAAVLRVCYRLPIRQVVKLFEQLPGLKLSPGAVTKQVRRLSQWLEGDYDRLKRVLRAADVVHADETGWRIDGKNGYLWTLTNATHTLYHVHRSRGGQVIADLLGEAFGGTLVSDFYAVYDQFDCRQQKCLTHLLRELRETIARQPAFADRTFFKGCKRLVGEMLRLKKRQPAMPVSAFARQLKSIETRLANLGGKRWKEADAERLAGRLRKYGTRLTTFLHEPHVDGTNNAAERALRPAVVMRKITGGSRSESGAQAWAILASLMPTAEQQGRDVLETIRILIRASWAGKNIALLTDT